MTLEQATPERVDAPDETPDRCTNCRAPLEPDQEWCLECGAGRTRIHPPPDWRIATGIVAALVIAALIAFAIVIVNLRSNASAGASVVTVTTTSAPPTTSAAAPATPTFQGWPVGLSGWTVVLASSRTQAGADAAAAGLTATGISVGVLDSSRHPSMTPGFWFVFSGRYPNGPLARAAAAALRTQGQPSARARRVAPPGGL